MNHWHTCAFQDVVEYWQTDALIGLSSKEVKKRLEKHGYNMMREAEKTPWWVRLFAQFQDFMVVILLAATLISACLGEYVDAITILAIVIVNAVLGFVQEYRAEKSIEALKKITAPTARVMRNGTVQHVEAIQLVPGDIILLEAGDKIAADGRLIEGLSFEVEEATLTGESIPTKKYYKQTYAQDAGIGDRKNLIYAGTSVTRGRGKAVVYATGMDTEVGKIADMIQETKDEDTPLEKRLEHLGHWLVLGCLFICLLVIITGVIKGEPLFLMCMAGISLAVAAIPEGLPAIVTVALALGVQRMIKRNAIIRKLPAVETLGCVTVICSDKTGTLTQNAMTVREVFVGKQCYEVAGIGYDIQGTFLKGETIIDPAKDTLLSRCLMIGALCNNSILKKNNVGISGLWRNSKDSFEIEGDPTEGALIVAAAKADIWRENLEKESVRIYENPFESERRRMSVIYEQNGNSVIYIKGAPDTILDLCSYYDLGDKTVPLTEKDIVSIMGANEVMTGKALRVLALAYRPLSKDDHGVTDTMVEKELIFVGLIGMIDPPREEAKQAIDLCRQAGIKTVMITGDHKNTAVAIAKELRMYRENEHQSLTGRELDNLSDMELGNIVNKVTVYARVSPAHKLRIVRALKHKGHIVAMTGDGINDAPAVKEADIGISMGLTGTDVTKEASAMILADDNFASIVAAVEEGRGIYDNIRKFIRYLIACNLGEVMTMFMASLAGMPLPLLPVQILWVNLVTDGLPAMALGVDSNSRNIMYRPPRNPKESVFSRGLARKVISRGMQIGFSTLVVFAIGYYYCEDLVLARTMAFVTLVLSQMFHVFDCRSEELTIFETGIFKNKYLLIAVACSVTMQLAVIYNPFLSSLFTTKPLSVLEWCLVLVVCGWTFILNAIKHLLGMKPSMKTVYENLR